MRRLLVVATMLIAACSTGPAAPDVGGVELACIDPFCIEYPTGWDVAEEGRDFISFSNPAAPGQALATIGPVNPRAIVENAGGTWPVTTAEVVSEFWSLLESAGVAEMEHAERLTGGAVRSEGSHETGRLWHLLIPGTADHAVAVEVRGPNRSWETHADVFFGNVEVFG